MVTAMDERSLANLIKERIESAFGGNQAAFARAVGMKTGTLNTIVQGRVTLPQADLRRRLAAELGIPHVLFFVMAGELLDEELTEAGVQGVVEEGPKAHLHVIVDQYDWKWGEALSMGDMIQAYMKRRNELNVASIPLTFIPKEDETK